jgi:hypothetical protein
MQNCKRKVKHYKLYCNEYVGLEMKINKFVSFI